ncbi:hypothetical protein H7U33_01890 [Collinsella intestinalis]|nr:hypothetical protein [Collinsella intestinalis]
MLLIRMSAADLFIKGYSKENLNLVFRQSVLGSTAVGVDRVTTDNFLDHIDEQTSIISRKVLSGAYSFTSYRQLLEIKNAKDAPRELCIPTVRDRLTLKVLAAIIVEVFGDLSKTPNPQRTIGEISKAISSKSYSHYVKVDFKHFYNMIDHELLFVALRSKIRKKELLGLIESAITTPATVFGKKAQRKPLGLTSSKGLPQGLSISNLLANVYASRFDRDLLKRLPTIFYRRYVDDIIIFCTEDRIKAIKKTINNLAKRYRLELNPDKCRVGRIASDRFDYLGYEYHADTISIRGSSKRLIENSLERRIKKVARAKEHGGQREVESSLRSLARRVTGCRVTYDGVSYQRYGWLCYFSRINDVAYLARLDRLVVKFAARYGVRLPKDFPTFKKSYYQMRYNGRNTSYIPVFDYSAKPEEMRDALIELVDEEFLNKCTDEQLLPLYRKLLHKIIRSLEKDVGMIS